MFFYNVRPGDTLYSIAARFGVQIAAILAVNPGLNPFNLYTGLAILIPALNGSGLRSLSAFLSISLIGIF